MLTENLTTAAATTPVLTGAPVVYLIVYVNDLAESRSFYRDKLGLPVLQDDEDDVKFDAGRVVLCLQRASDYGITLAGRADDASDIVFLVDDVNAMRAALEARGVEFVRRRTYEIGLVTDFYDPNGHRLMIYEPSEKALSWPSAEKLRELWRTCGRGRADLIGPPAIVDTDPGSAAARGLRGKPLVYLFMFVPDSADALTFYQATLGLNPIEMVHCCNPACPPEEKGIAKYDAGGLLLTTHHIHRSPVVDDFGKVYSPRVTEPSHVKGVVPVFHVRDLPAVVDRLKGFHVQVDDVQHSHIGDLAWFEAPTGHRFCVYSPSPGALRWPAGRRLSELAATGASERQPVPSEK